MRRYWLYIIWSSDESEVETEMYTTQEELEARLAYLRTIPREAGISWEVEVDD